MAITHAEVFPCFLSPYIKIIDANRDFPKPPKCITNRGGGINPLSARVYRNIRFKNKVQGKRFTKTDNPSAKRRATGKIDEYDCVAYSVPYPEEETDATQEEKKATTSL